MIKILGYVFALGGILGLGATTFTPLAGALPFISQISKTTLTILSLILILVGVFIIIKKPNQKESEQAETEVPIFKGKKVIGYRRVDN
jgi:hypothetical protein